MSEILSRETISIQITKWQLKTARSLTFRFKPAPL